MIPSKKTFEVPLDLLEEAYWSDSGFCTSCEEFFNGKVEPGDIKECPVCENECFFDVDFLIKKEILLGID